jgi:hypothetical protein
MNALPEASIKLITIICLVLVVIAYFISTLFKNLICRCIRCPAIENTSIAQFTEQFLTKVVQLLLLIVYLNLSQLNVKSNTNGQGMS